MQHWCRRRFLFLIWSVGQSPLPQNRLGENEERGEIFALLLQLFIFDQGCLAGQEWRLGRGMIPAPVSEKQNDNKECRNPAAPGLLDGEYGTLQQSHALLLEIPLNSQK